MKTISRYTSLLCITGVLATGSLFAQSSPSDSATNTPRADNTTGTSGSTNNTTPNSMNSSSGNSGSTMNSDSSMNSSSASMTPSVSSTSNLGTDSLSTTLQSADYANRSDLAKQVEQRIDSEKDTLKNLKKEGKNLEGQSKSDFKAAWEDVTAREKDLKHSAHRARNASQDQWESARSQLASNYQAFEAAVSRLQAQVGNTSTSTSSSTLSR